jgi:hypothetical protein
MQGGVFDEEVERMVAPHPTRLFASAVLAMALGPLLSPVATAQTGRDPCVATDATVEIKRSVTNGWYLHGTGTMECGGRTGHLTVSFTRWERPCCGVPSAVESGIAERDYIGPGTTLTIEHNLEAGAFCWSTLAEVSSAGIYTVYTSDLACEE